VIDGGSKDGSIEIIKSYEDRISGWISEPDGGYAEAVDKGFAMAESKFQYWLACGDLMLPGALSLARSILTQTKADMIFGDDFYIDVDGHVLQLTNGYAPNLSAMMLSGDWTPLQDACFWRSSLYRRVGGLNIDFRYAADYDLFLRMALCGRCEYTPHVFSAFRSHEGQTSQKHRGAYRDEKFAAKTAVARSHDLPRILVLTRFFYWFYARFRARIWSAKTLAPQFLGSAVRDHVAGLCKGFGGGE
jgi:GT2 family glycosyltransferase